MGQMFISYLDEAVRAGIKAPDFIRLTRQKPYQGSVMEYEDQELLVGYFPIEDENEYLSTHYVDFSTSKEKKATQMTEILLIDNYKMETAYFDLSNRWKNVKDLFNSLGTELLYHDWLEYYSDSGVKSDFPDFIRFLRKKDGGFMDYMRCPIQFESGLRSAFVRIEYRPGRTGGEILPLTEESAARLEDGSPVEILTARFSDHSKEVRTKDRFAE